ncbi:VanZ family protein [Paenibacillus sp. JTLBN-2024]
MYDQQLRHERYHQQNNDAGARPAESNPAHAAIKLGVILLFVVYLYALVKIILFKFGSISPVYYLRELVDHILHPGMIADRLRMVSNLMPLREIEGYLRDLGDGVSFMNFFGNIAAFMPLGFLLPMVCGVRSMTLPKVLLLSFGVSLALESLQLVLFIGTFDVDDIIMNTAGGLLGYAAYLVLYFLLKQGEQGRNRNQPF